MKKVFLDEKYMLDVYQKIICQEGFTKTLSDSTEMLKQCLEAAPLTGNTHLSHSVRKALTISPSTNTSSADLTELEKSVSAASTAAISLKVQFEQQK